MSDKNKLEIIKKPQGTVIRLGKIAEDGYYRGFSKEMAAEIIIWEPKQLEGLLGRKFKPEEIPIKFVIELGGDRIDFRNLREMMKVKKLIKLFFEELERLYPNLNIDELEKELF